MKKVQRVYLLREEDEGSGEIHTVGIFSSEELARKTHEAYDNIWTHHVPRFWEITEHVIDYHVYKLEEDFGIEL
jgi:hypothetical protein